MTNFFPDDLVGAVMRSTHLNLEGQDCGLGSTEADEKPSAGVAPPKTLAEQLDAATTGSEFGAVLSGLFDTLDRQRTAEGEQQ